MYGFYWKFLISDCLTSLESFEWFSIFLICLALLVPEKLKNTNFRIPIILQSLNINNLGTISAKSINLGTIRNLTEYSSKKVSGEENIYSNCFRDIAVRS